MKVKPVLPEVDALSPPITTKIKRRHTIKKGMKKRRQINLRNRDRRDGADSAENGIPKNEPMSMPTAAARAVLSVSKGSTSGPTARRGGGRRCS